MNNISRKDDINALIAKIKLQYSSIDDLYRSSLRRKEIDSGLRIEIKNYLENARSILDYCAHDIADTSSITSREIYFPIVGKDKNKNSFDGIIGRNLPNLESKNKKVFDYLESIQPYYQTNSWLADFATVNNDNKHSQLTPQTRIETERIISKHIRGNEVSWNPSLTKFGPGAFIKGAPVDPVTQMPTPTQYTTIAKEIWVDFRFNNTISALSLMRSIHDGVPIIIDQIYAILQVELEA